MKKNIFLYLLVILSITIFGCSNKENSNSQPPPSSSFIYSGYLKNPQIMEQVKNEIRTKVATDQLLSLTLYEEALKIQTQNSTTPTKINEFSSKLILGLPKEKSNSHFGDMTILRER